MLKKFLALSAFIFFTCLIAYAGSSDTRLHCESESGRTKLDIVIQDYDGGLIKAEFTIDGVSLSFGSGCESHAIADLKNGVYTISLNQAASGSNDETDKFLDFWGIPASFLPIADTRCIENYKFKGKVDATGANAYTIKLNCTLNYCI